MQPGYTLATLPDPFSGISEKADGFMALTLPLSIIYCQIAVCGCCMYQVPAELTKGCYLLIHGSIISNDRVVPKSKHRRP